MGSLKATIRNYELVTFRETGRTLFAKLVRYFPRARVFSYWTTIASDALDNGTLRTRIDFFSEFENRAIARGVEGTKRNRR